MKLLQINEYQYVNPEMITCIEDESPCCRGCYIHLAGDNTVKWSNMSVLEIMSKICEEVYYGDDGICKEDK